MKERERKEWKKERGINKERKTGRKKDKKKVRTNENDLTFLFPVVFLSRFLLGVR